MKYKYLLIAVCLLFISLYNAKGQKFREESLLERGWKFTKGDFQGAGNINFNDKVWKNVEIPHDWAIKGPFSPENDKQDVAIAENNEKQASVKTGRTGGLPYVGVGWYRIKFDVKDFSESDQAVTLLFDGAMSDAMVYVNGKEVVHWPYGYNSFFVDVTDYLSKDGKDNVLAVRLENKPESSRWYPGAGLYRNVHLIVTRREHVPVWGTYLTTPYVSKEYASVSLKTSIENVSGKEVRLHTELKDSKGSVVATKDNAYNATRTTDSVFGQNFIVEHPVLWSPDTPYLYTAETKVYVGDTQVDEYSTKFGIRDIKFVADKGFLLNGEVTKIKGVCNHHDLGPLGAAVNVAALRRQLTLLKDMGCNAIRTSHNMPAPELVSLCDEMGIMLMAESFDEWDVAKCKNGYHLYFKDWAEKDLVNLVHHYRNDPSVIMWSVGNEVPSQWDKSGIKTAEYLQDICHREDPTRPATAANNGVEQDLKTGFLSVFDIPGLNYNTGNYKKAYDILPRGYILGSETASTVSSRGVYKLPIVKKYWAKYPDQQSSSYDLEYCSWSNIPDYDFALADDNSWDIGQFVWTGFDYLGEPTPYDEMWPNHSSMFGIIDLASIPKDRYYLYRSVWNPESPTLHILPHWNWPGKEGQKVPVFVYTSYPSAELFINGKSYGRLYKNKSTVESRYRLMWMDAVYEPGTVKVVAYDDKGEAVDTAEVKTAGTPDHIELVADRQTIAADGKDLSYINVRIVDKAGNLCPTDGRLVEFSVKGAGRYKASASGDPTCLDSFQAMKMHTFSGQLTAIVQSTDKSGVMMFKASAKGLKPSEIKIKTE